MAATKHLGISNGIGENLFAPEREITREEMFVMLFNVLKTDLPVGVGVAFSNYTDSGDISDYALEALTYIIENGLVVGTNGNLTPNTSLAALCWHSYYTAC